jgi:ATP-dependent phosphofructokinase / diphosphate-dependent phosphofructokinase
MRFDVEIGRFDPAPVRLVGAGFARADTSAVESPDSPEVDPAVRDERRERCPRRSRWYPSLAIANPSPMYSGPLTTMPIRAPTMLSLRKKTMNTAAMIPAYSNHSRTNRRHGTGRSLSQRLWLLMGQVPTRRGVRSCDVRVGILTGGGDCPGLNAVIRAAVRVGERLHGDEMIGFLDAWDGVRERRTIELTVESMRGTLPKGGTVLGTRRGSPFDVDGGVEQVESTFAELGLDGLIVIGGNGTLTVACRLHDDHGLPIVGVPKTIDNDIVGTDLTFGFNTAVQIATDAIDRLHTTAESHDRVMVVEVMGRHTGWIATHAGIAGGATAVLIPEIPFDIDELCARLIRRHDGGRYASIVVVAEGAEPKPGTLAIDNKVYDRFGHVLLGGVTTRIAEAIRSRTGFDTRVVQLGHVQRGGTPTAFDRVLSTRFGVGAIDAVHRSQWGKMTVLRGDHIVLEDLSIAVGKTRPVDVQLYHDVAEPFFA